MKLRFFLTNDWKDGSIYFDFLELTFASVGRQNSKKFGLQFIVKILGLGFVLNVFNKE